MKYYTITVLALILFMGTVICIDDEDTNTNEETNEETNGETNEVEENENTDTEPTDETNADDAKFCETKQDWGFQCNGCDKMVKCMKSGETWIQVELGPCDNQKEFCSKSEKKCSATKDCETVEPPPTVKFECKSEGIFPNPYDCKLYHICSTKAVFAVNQIDMNCPDGFAFNPAKNQCNVPVSKFNACTKQQYNCKNEYDTAPWPTNKNIYYLCKKETGKATFYVELLSCGPNEIYDQSQERCISK